MKGRPAQSYLSCSVAERSTTDIPVQGLYKIPCKTLILNYFGISSLLLGTQQIISSLLLLQEAFLWLSLLWFKSSDHCPLSDGRTTIMGAQGNKGVKTDEV